MDDTLNLRPPAVLAAIERDTAAIGFDLGAQPRTGAMLRTLVATKPGGAFLEIGTGTGISTAWILDAMDTGATLLTVDRAAKYVEIAKRHLGHDPRVTLRIGDGAAFLRELRGREFDLIFADTWPGKFDHLEDAIDRLRPGGLYVIDDLPPQPNWPQDHAPKVPRLIAPTRAQSEPRVVQALVVVGNHY